MVMGGERVAEELEMLLRRFNEGEVPKTKIVELKPEDPLLLLSLLAQHRSF
jgi:hypothetical protein